MSSTDETTFGAHSTAYLKDEIHERCMELIRWNGHRERDFADHMANFDACHIGFFNSLVSEPEVIYASGMLALHFRYYETAKSDDPIRYELLFNPYLFAVYGSSNSEEDLGKVDEALFWSDQYTGLVKDIDTIFIRLGCDCETWASHRALFLRSLWAWDRLQNALSVQVAACTHHACHSSFTFVEGTGLGAPTCRDGTLGRSFASSDLPSQSGYRAIFTHGVVDRGVGGNRNPADEWAEPTQLFDKTARKMQKRSSSPASTRLGVRPAPSIAATSVPPLSSSEWSGTLPFRGKRKAS